jgi:eukaryotic-like serine/threonine-protein kinase
MLPPLPGDPGVSRVSHYEVLQRLGAGGMGEVYEGVDQTLKRRVALKVVHRNRRLDALAHARFRREAQILSQLDHPHICRVYDYIEGKDHDWLVLEFIEGESLELALRRLDRAGRLRLARQIADVLVVTHAAGIVHRDLKPGNILVTTTGLIKVLDYGLAQITAPSPPDPWTDVRTGRAPATEAGLAEPPESDPDATRPGPPLIAWTEAPVVSLPGGITGTLTHMSPEQARGEPATPASDMYAFGLILQEMLSGEPPYRHVETGAALLERKRRGDVDPPPASLGKDLVTLVKRLTALAPSRRPTAVEAAERLQWIQDRPKRRARWLAAAAIVLAFSGGGVKYLVDVTTQRNLADQRRGQAEALVTFMLGDLRGKLLQAGRLELLEDVGREALAYFEAVPSEALSVAEIAQRAKAMHQIGQIRQAQNDLAAALEAYQQSRALATVAATRAPEDPTVQVELGNAHFYVGDALRRMGDLEAAMVAFEQYRDVGRGLAARDPENPDWQLERAYGEGGVAAILEAQGRLAEARAALEEVQAIRERLARGDPSRLDWQLAVATGHNRLGVVVEKLGDAEARSHHFQADVDIRRRLVEAHPANATLKRPFFVALTYLARALADDGETARSEALHREAFEVAQAMAASDPANANWRRDAASAEAQLAAIEVDLGRLRDAEAHYAHAAAVLGPMAAANRTNAGWQRDAAIAELGLARTRRLLGDDVSALEGAARAVALLHPLLASAFDPLAARFSAEAELEAAAVLESRGRAAEARRKREHALALLGEDGPGGDSLLRVVRARILAELGRIDEARAIVTAVAATGHRSRRLTFVQSLVEQSHRGGPHVSDRERQSDR